MNTPLPQPQNQLRVDTDKNESVMGFMRQIVQEKYGDTRNANFREQEANRIYNEFVDKLVTHFKPMVSEKGKKESVKLDGQSVDQNALLGLLMDSVENLEQKIVNFLKNFRGEYLKDSS